MRQNNHIRALPPADRAGAESPQPAWADVHDLTQTRDWEGPALRAIRKTLKLQVSALFDAEMQDRCACYLLGLRGIDKYLAGRLSQNTFINNLAHEWAPFPTIAGKGAYAGQNVTVSPDRVREVLAEVRERHGASRPAREIVVEREVDKPLALLTVEAEIRKRTDQWSWITTIFGSGGAGFAALAGMG